MNIKTALLAGAAAAFMTVAPALAQETTPAPAAAPAAAASSQQSLSLNPGSSVSGPDGELGKLEGVQNNAEGKQELTVRGADGQLRAVPLSGIRQEGTGVVVAYTKAEFDAAAPIAGAPAAPAADPAAAPAPTSEPAAEPTSPATTEPATPAPDSATPAPTEPQ
ncbi:hypothetical protein ABIC32_001809 [Brevundimonas sp. 1080]|uniref:hypothetical protein n=1 Tax=Brevundimonas sp. 1080 TaxID=3156405 RepID=UPI0033959EC2